MSGTQFSLASYSQSPKRARRMSSYGPTQASRAGGRKRRIIGRLSLARTVATKTPIFQETVFAAQLASNGGGIWAPRISALPELADYTALYRSYRILKCEVIIMPNNVFVGGSPSGNGQLAYAIDTSSELATPGSQTDVLNNNECKLVLMDKAARISFKPAPSVTVGSAAGGNTGITMRPQWLSLDDGQNVPHNGVTYWFYNTGTNVTYQVFFKYTFQCKDPR